MRSIMPFLLLFSTLLIVQSASADNAGDAKITVKLVDLIQKKQYDAFTKEISIDNMDVNQPTPSGKLPLIEAVKTKDLRFVDALIQYGANLKIKEPATGASPISLAFQAGLVDISKLLLAYGADPSVPAKNDKKASDFLSSNGIKELYAIWQKEGPMALEDAPGTWIKAKDGGKFMLGDQGYWYNRVTALGRWNMPPSCAWQRVEQRDEAPTFVNYVTGQTLHSTPKALSWRKIRFEGEEVWYNWALNISQHEVPEEMPDYLLEEASSSLNVRWFNEKTGEHSWEDPRLKNPWRIIEDKDGSYYYNVATGESQWDKPAGMAWAKHESETGPYFHNSITGESSWEVPDHEAWELTQSSFQMAPPSSIGLDNQYLTVNEAALYAAMQRAENRVGGGEGLEGVYGSITRGGTTEMLDAFKEHSGLDQNSVMLDIGSGLGRPLLHAIVHSRVAATYGIEVDAVKCQKAVPFVQHTVTEMLGHDVKMPGLPKFICCPIEQIPSLEPATHIYSAWEGFARGAMEAVGKLFSASSTAKAITIVQRSFRQRDPAEEMNELGFGQVKLVFSLPVFMSGSGRRLMAYCFVRESLPKVKKSIKETTDLSTMKAFHPENVLNVLTMQANERSNSKGAAKLHDVVIDDTAPLPDTYKASNQRCSTRLADRKLLQGALEGLAMSSPVKKSSQTNVKATTGCSVVDEAITISQQRRRKPL